MATTQNNNSNHSQSTTTSNTAKPRTRARKPPVAERVTVSAPLAVPPTSSAAPPPAPPASPPPGGAAGPTSPPGNASSSGANGAAGAAVPISAPPQVSIPAVPTGFVPVSAADLRGFHAFASQVAAVPDAIAELKTFTGYTAVFGITAPDVGQLTDRLRIAYQWTMLLSQTAAWYKYAKSQQGMAWKDAVLLLDTLKPAFDLASTANPALLSQHPALARLLGARGVVAKRAASTRAKKKKAAEQPPATAGAATPEAAASPAPEAANAGTQNGAAAPAAAGARIVTVQG